MSNVHPIPTAPQPSAGDEIKFAYWVPNVSGGLVISNIEQRTGWDIDYNRKLAQIAEASGLRLCAQPDPLHRRLRRRQPARIGLASATRCCGDRAAEGDRGAPAGAVEPGAGAKQIATINHLTNGRIAVNVVSGWFRGEFAAIGEPWLDHDERYRRSEEFIRACAASGPRTTSPSRGDFYRFRNYSMRRSRSIPQPEIFQGGSARAPRATWRRGFRTGTSPTATRPRASGKQVDDIRAKAAAERPHGQDRRQRLRHRPRDRGRGEGACSTRSSPRPTPTRCTASPTR